MPIAQRWRWDLGCQPLFTLGSRLGAFPFAVQVDDRHANDSPQFSTLLTSMVETRFKASEVSADAAYLVYENMQLAGTLNETLRWTLRLSRCPSHPKRPSGGFLGGSSAVPVVPVKTICA